MLCQHSDSILFSRDAGFGKSAYDLTLLDCLRGLEKAIKYRFIDFNDFDVDEYERYEVGVYVFIFII